MRFGSEADRLFAFVQNKTTFLFWFKRRHLFCLCFEADSSFVLVKRRKDRSWRINPKPKRCRKLNNNTARCRSLDENEIVAGKTGLLRVRGSRVSNLLVFV